ncbi:hypothetical protein QQX98_000709 [Neonectria punicea]|uniref:Uncharacterized protein n=1 Tax=Neonectria punicea TaxID=979145 RepID=A0ABR1HTF9_9HYPO
MLLLEFSHRPRMETEHSAEQTIMTLKRPTLSAIGPGKQRPKIDAAFVMARICGEMLGKPWKNAYVVMYAGGTKTAQSRMKIADMVNVNRTSLNPRQSNMVFACLFRGSRVFKSNKLSRRQTALRSAKHRSTQGNCSRFES